MWGLFLNKDKDELYKIMNFNSFQGIFISLHNSASPKQKLKRSQAGPAEAEGKDCVVKYNLCCEVCLFCLFVLLFQ